MAGAVPTVVSVAAARALPRRSDYAGLRVSWRGDVLAGVTVGVVALPLALAFGVTSGDGAAEVCDTLPEAIERARELAVPGR